MSKKLSGPKLTAVILLLVVGAAAGFGYFKQSSVLTKDEPKLETGKAAEGAKIDPTALAVKPDDIILGDANALVTIVEYASLSCTHCAHFHETVLPDLQKDFIDTGKVRLVIRHFPLNAPALKAAELVECAGEAGQQRANFMKVLFNLQSKWAFDEQYLASLKQIAGVGGIDSAAFDSCMANKDLETRLLAVRQEAQDKLAIDSTPYFFINGAKFEGDRTIEGFSKAIQEVLAVQK